MRFSYLVPIVFIGLFGVSLAKVPIVHSTEIEPSEVHQSVFPRPVESPTLESAKPTPSVSSRVYSELLSTELQNEKIESSHSRTAGPTPPIPMNSEQRADPAADCAAASVAPGPRGLFVIYADVSPELVWDTRPREFRVGICNSHPVPLVPDSQFLVTLRLPETGRIPGQTERLRAQLGPGFHELILKQWVPGYENHVTICVQKPAVQVIVEYSDQADSPVFHPLRWLDGSEGQIYLIRCGGDFA